VLNSLKSSLSGIPAVAVLSYFQIICGIYNAFFYQRKKQKSIRLLSVNDKAKYCHSLRTNCSLAVWTEWLMSCQR
jgi:hypothetical protein